MARLIYLAQMSLDGYVADERGSFEWAAPDEEVHQAVNDLERSTGTFLLGRRTYEVLRVWDDPAIGEGQPPVIADFAGIWCSADRVVYSRTLGTATTARTRIEREFEAAAVRELKARSGGDLSIGGPELAVHAFRAGLVDECHLFMVPVLVGGGTAALPRSARIDLELIATRRFEQGTVYAGYRVKR